jgi:RNA recognition motif-containing protein
MYIGTYKIVCIYIIGCGIVEYSNPGEAQTAINNLNDRDLMGRQVFVREDRE